MMNLVVIIIIFLTWALILSSCLTDLGLTKDMPLLTSECLRPLARRPI